MALIRRLIFLALVIAAVSWPYSGRGQTGAKNGEWRAYAAEEASTKYSPLDQITRDNVKNLEVAWTFKIDNFGSAAQTATNESTPIMSSVVATVRAAALCPSTSAASTMPSARIDDARQAR